MTKELSACRCLSLKLTIDYLKNNCKNNFSRRILKFEDKKTEINIFSLNWIKLIGSGAANSSNKKISWEFCCKKLLNLFFLFYYWNSLTQKWLQHKGTFKCIYHHSHLQFQFFFFFWLSNNKFFKLSFQLDKIAEDFLWEKFQNLYETKIKPQVKKFVKCCEVW